MLILSLIFFTLTNFATPSAKNNVCESIEDYYTIDDNKNCWYDYITDLELPELLVQSGIRFERYKAVTPDGYILSLFRIPNSESANKKKSPVFLQHGFVATAKHWVSLGNDSLAFQLHNNGYDVWMGNYRGTKYSEEHISLSVNDEAYWEHTLDDLALLDIPTMLNKVVEVTGTKGDIIYIGHSLGCTMGLMYASDLTEKAKKYMKAMILISPAYKLSHMITPAKEAVIYAEQIWSVVKSQRLLKYTSHGIVSNGFIRFFCFKSPKLMYSCMELSGQIFGPKYGIKPDQFPNYLKQLLTGSSIKVLYHLISLVKGTFSKFDYGLNNTFIYGQRNVPGYDVSKIVIPTTIFTSKNDWLTAHADVLRLADEMNTKYVHDIVTIGDDYFNHMDYLFGSRSKELFIDVIMRYINNFNAMAVV